MTKRVKAKKLGAGALAFAMLTVGLYAVNEQHVGFADVAANFCLGAAGFLVIAWVLALVEDHFTDKRRERAMSEFQSNGGYSARSKETVVGLAELTVEFNHQNEALRRSLAELKERANKAESQVELAKAIAPILVEKAVEMNAFSSDLINRLEKALNLAGELLEDAEIQSGVLGKIHEALKDSTWNPDEESTAVLVRIGLILMVYNGDPKTIPDVGPVRIVPSSDSPALPEPSTEVLLPKDSADG